jgi:hypothetical protein
LLPEGVSKILLPERVRRFLLKSPDPPDLPDPLPPPMHRGTAGHAAADRRRPADPPLLPITAADPPVSAETAAVAGRRRPADRSAERTAGFAAFRRFSPVSAEPLADRRFRRIRWPTRRA